MTEIPSTEEFQTTCDTIVCLPSCADSSCESDDMIGPEVLAAILSSCAGIITLIIIGVFMYLKLCCKMKITPYGRYV